MRRTFVTALLTVTLASASVLVLPITRGSAAAPGAWQPAGAMLIARASAAAVTLRSGAALVAGGTADGATSTASDELYDPTASTWTPMTNMTTPRSNLTLTVLADGRVLAAAGLNGGSVLGTAEVYDPTTNAWVPTGAMFGPRFNQVAALLKNGLVLVVGGTDGTTPLASAEIYDPSVNGWSVAATLTTPRVGATATVLADGRVLVAGGTDGNAILNSAELYDPVHDIWSAAGTMIAAREFQTATLLTDGRVLIAGGYGAAGALRSAEIFDPTSNTFTATGLMATARGDAVAGILPNGGVVVAGGKGSIDPTTPALASAEAYDPATGTWTSAGSMQTARAMAASTVLAGGDVLVAGGRNGTSFLKSADRYNYSPPTATPTITPTFTVTPTPAPETPTAVPTDTPTDTPTVVLTDTPTATSTPVVPQFSRLAVRIEPDTGKPDWQGKTPELRSVKVGQTVQISTYTQFTSLPENARMVVSLLVTRGKRTVRRGGLTTRYGPNDAAGLWQHTTFRPLDAGSYAVSVKVTVNGVSKTASTTLTVVRAVPAAAIFAFSTLQVLDYRNRPVTVVTRGRRVTVRASWRAAGRSSFSVQLTEALQIPVGNNWQTLGTPLRTSFDAPAGAHAFSFSFVPAGSYRALRVVVDLRIAGKTLSKSVVVSLRG